MLGDPEKPAFPSKSFASHVFNTETLQNLVDTDVYLAFFNAIQEKKPLDLQWFTPIADALKEWSLQRGATHFTHWFQPLTGAPAEKHDAFLNWSHDRKLIEHFEGKELYCSEPDASSLPSGGLRATHRARGYAVWDLAAPPFLYENGHVVTLCIPAVYFSWEGDALDYKIPLLRSEEKMADQVMRLLKLANISSKGCFSTLGIEQEYFILEKELFLARNDLCLTGRTLYGARPTKKQELEDHYFSTMNPRIISYMKDVEERALKLGIPLRTRHNEVAPSQHEVAPLFEKASIAIDHNLLLMQLMKHVAQEHDLACLFHEKPFAGFNGSGKHCNWSIATYEGKNLLKPEKGGFVFFTLLTAILKAVHDHAGLLRASVASCSNDHRLGGYEAPPTIFSVYLGSYLEQLIEEMISKERPLKELSHLVHLHLPHLPQYEGDISDRNRTSSFAFTGNRFEFRAVGSSQHPAFPICIVQAIVADALQLILDEIDDVVQHQKLKEEELFELSLPILVHHLKEARPVVFNGDAYSKEWESEAKARGLLNLKHSPDAYKEMLSKSAERVFEGVLTKKELHARYEILLERYVKQTDIEILTMIELFRTAILPSVLQDQKRRAKALVLLSQTSIKVPKEQTASLETLVFRLTSAIQGVDALEDAFHKSQEFHTEAKAVVYAGVLLAKMQEARDATDALEQWVHEELWPFPKYRELLLLVISFS